MTDDTGSGDHHHLPIDRKELKSKWKFALARTKSKFQKQDSEPQTRTKQDYQLSEDVNDFLAAGRVRPTPSEDRLIMSTTSPVPSSPNHSSTDLSKPQRSPRGVVIPKLDVSHTMRFPAARPVDEHRSMSSEYLRPALTNKERSQSLSSFKKPHSRPRHLSVNFDGKPPVIIGLGGEEAEQPPIEISRLRQRARSLSPMPPPRPSSKDSFNSASSQSSIKRKPVPSPSPNHLEQPRSNPFEDNGDDDPDFVPKPLARAPTGLGETARHTDREFELSLHTPDTAVEDQHVDNHFRTAIVSPKPIHPPTLPPVVPVEPIRTPLPAAQIASVPAPGQNQARGEQEQDAKVVPFDADEHISSTPLKPGSIRVTITNNDVPAPTLPAESSFQTTAQEQPSSQPSPPQKRGGPPIPPRRKPNFPVGGVKLPMPHEQQAEQSNLPIHQKIPTINETETMSHGANGWL